MILKAPFLGVAGIGHCPDHIRPRGAIPAASEFESGHIKEPGNVLENPQAFRE